MEPIIGSPKTPFEPMDKASIKWVTLASGKRRSELHAIERNGISWPEDKNSVTLRVSPSFVAKTQLSANVRSIQPFKIKSLGDFLSQGMAEDMRLYSVRAYKQYSE